MIVAIIQARFGSTRLPGKVLRLIARRTMLSWVIERTQRITGLDWVVVATSTDPSDDAIASLCQSLAVGCARGPLHDVLGRYEKAAQDLRLKPTDRIIRVTGDCPALDPAVSRQVVDLQERHRVDYAANLRDWPDGLDTEVFTRAALQEAFHFATGDEDREHVTPWMRRNLFCLELPRNPPLRHLKWSVDTEEDLEYVRELYRGLRSDFSWGEILALTPRIGDSIRDAETPARTSVALDPGGAALRNPNDDPACREDVGGR